MLGPVSLETAALIPLAHVLPPEFVSQEFSEGVSFQLLVLSLRD